MGIQELKNPSRARMAKAAECSSDDDSSYAFESLDQPEQFKELDPEMSKGVKRKYNDLQHSEMSVDNDKYNSFLLPSFLPNCGEVTVHVKGIKDAVLTTASEVSSSKFINKIVEEKNDAVKLTMHYRNLVEALQSENRKLHCTMNDSIDTVRKFWRNSILEGRTRKDMLNTNHFCVIVIL